MSFLRLQTWHASSVCPHTLIPQRFFDFEVIFNVLILWKINKFVLKGRTGRALIYIRILSVWSSANRCSRGRICAPHYFFHFLQKLQLGILSFWEKNIIRGSAYAPPPIQQKMIFVTPILHLNSKKFKSLFFTSSN